MNVILIARLHQKLSDTVWKIKFKYLGDYRKLKKNRGDTDQSQLQSFANEKTDHTSDLIWHLHEKEQDSNQWNMLTRCCGQCWDWQTCPELKNSASKTPSALENLSILVNKAAKKTATTSFKCTHHIFRLCCHQIIKLWLRQNRRQWKSAITPRGANACTVSEGSCPRLPQCSQVFVNPTNKNVCIFSPHFQCRLRVFMWHIKLGK